jgi:cation transport regulator ChaC
MDPSTEIASGFPVARYAELRRVLDPARLDQPEWRELVEAFRRRIEERFLGPISHMRKGSGSKQRPGFAIIALDCLLIDALQSFREGRVTTGESSPAKSFADFLRRPRFRQGGFNSEARAEFFDCVRNGLMHNGETRGDWKIRADKATMMLTRSGAQRILNRNKFHDAIAAEFSDYCSELESGSVQIRERFLIRMDAICGLRPPSYYFFAYGSCLHEAEIVTAMAESGTAEFVGIARLSGWRMVFNKHSTTRGDRDAANIERHSSRVVWGAVYRVDESGKKALIQREGGYQQCPLKPLLLQDVADHDKVRPIDAFTFIAKARCTRSCGPSEDYLKLVLEGARSRNLPHEYIKDIKSA